MKRIMLVCLWWLGIACASPVSAEDLFMARSNQSFPETMLALQQAIREQGYTIARVQRVDIGLTTMGYQTDKYRIVFFGKPEEVKQLTAAYPRLIPYLPQKISLYAEGEQTIVFTANPAVFKTMYSEDGLTPVLDRWERDLRAIIGAVNKLD